MECDPQLACRQFFYPDTVSPFGIAFIRKDRFTCVQGFAARAGASMEEPEVKHLKSLEEENAKLKKLPAETMLDKEVLKEALKVALGLKY